MTQTLKTKVLIIGAGTGGYVAGIRCGQLGLDTILVDGGDGLGGTCLNVGCIPSKAIIHAASKFETVAKAADGGTLGITASKPAIDLKATMAWKDGIVRKLNGGVAALLKKAKVKVINGWAEFSDAKTCTVKTADGDITISAEHVILATGSEPVELPFLPFGGDVISSTEALALDKVPNRLVVVGGGYIGLEAAAVLRKLDCEVTLLEAQPRVLARVAGEELSAFYQAEHRAHGVDLRLETMVDCLEGEDGRVARVRLHDGSAIDADLVIVGIGIVPSVEPLAKAGAVCSNGVDVDGSCRTSLEDVFAIGDCAAHRSRWAQDAVLRIESVQNANDMATAAAKAICGDPQDYAAFPWFWSNQYDLKLQAAGLSTGYDATVLRGDPAARSFSVVYLRDG